MEKKVAAMGYVGAILGIMENGNSGLCWGYIGDNGKEHKNCRLYWCFSGDNGTGNGNYGLYWGYIMRKNRQKQKSKAQNEPATEEVLGL